MKSLLLSCTCVAVLMFGSPASAQNPSQPSSSFNYLNLTRGGNPAVNYYGIVRPNAFNQNALVTMQQDYNSLTQSSTQSDSNSVRATGHAATFMNFGHYYPRLNPGGGGSPGRSGGSPPSRR